MPINELIAGGIKLPQFNLPDYGADMAQMAQIQSARNQNALAQYQLGAAQRAEAKDVAFTNALMNAGTDEDAIANALLKSGKISEYSALLKAKEEKKKTGLERSKLENELVDQRLKQSRAILDTFDPNDPNIGVKLKSWHLGNHADEYLGPVLKRFGATTENSTAEIDKAIAGGPAEIEKFLNRSRLAADKFAELYKPHLTNVTPGSNVINQKGEVVYTAPAAPERPVSVAPGSTLVTPSGQTVYTAPNAPERPVSVAPGSTLVTPSGQTVFTAPNAPERPVAVAPGSALVSPSTGQPIYTAPDRPRAPHYVSSAQGVMAVDPQTNKVTPVLINGKPLIDSNTEHGRKQLDIALQRLNLSRQTEKRLQDEADSSGGLSTQALDIAAQMVIQSGVMPPLGSGKKASEARVQVMNRVAELQSNPDAATAAAGLISGKQDTVAANQSLKDFTSGISSRRVTANNTAINHLETINELADKLNNKDIRIVNAAGNAFGAATGQPAPTNFDAAKQLVAAEVIKAVVANGGSVKEREEAAQNFARANSPDQLKGVISTYKELLGGQLQSLEGQYKAGTKRDDFRTKFLTPNTQKVLPPVAQPAAAPSTNIPQAAIDFLKQGKGTRQQFDDQFGVGAAKKVLGN